MGSIVVWVAMEQDSIVLVRGTILAHIDLATPGAPTTEAVGIVAVAATN